MDPCGTSTFKNGTCMRNLAEPGARFRAAAPNHPEALLEETQAFQAVGEKPSELSFAFVIASRPTYSSSWKSSTRTQKVLRSSSSSAVQKANPSRNPRFRRREGKERKDGRKSVLCTGRRKKHGKPGWG